MSISFPNSYAIGKKKTSALTSTYIVYPVANAVKVLQACIHKSVKNGLFLNLLVAKKSQIQYDYAW